MSGPSEQLGRIAHWLQVNAPGELRPDERVSDAVLRLLQRRLDEGAAGTPLHLVLLPAERAALHEKAVDPEACAGLSLVPVQVHPQIPPLQVGITPNGALFTITVPIPTDVLPLVQGALLAADGRPQLKPMDKVLPLGPVLRLVAYREALGSALRPADAHAQQVGESG